MMKNSPTFKFAIVLILLAAITRFIPHPFNFTAIGAMALFSGAIIRDKRYAFLLPFIVLFLTDIFLGFHFSMLPVYLGFSITVGIGMIIHNKPNFLRIGIASILSSILFFLITNLPVWYMDMSLYPISWEGTMQSYFMALPFFRNQILGDLFYNAAIFGAYFFYSERLRPSEAAIKK